MSKSLQHILVAVVLACIAAFALASDEKKMSRQEYIARYADVAVREMKATGIPASITLAQACLESANGNSTLARKANNHFGIKCHGWKGKTMRRDDDERNECFRSYSNADESFRDHSDFLRYRDRYASLFELDPTDYKAWAYGLQSAGYATSRTYAASLIRIIEEEGLARYDQLNVEARDALPPTPLKAEASAAFKPLPGHRLYTASLSREIRTTNGVAWISARNGDTYEGLAREYNLFKRELLGFNDLKRDEPIHEGQLVYVEAKKRESARGLEKHVVEEGETLYGLSQRYAVKLKSLCKYNGLTPASRLQPGSIINLRRPGKR